MSLGNDIKTGPVALQCPPSRIAPADDNKPRNSQLTMHFSASTFSALVALGLSCVNSALATPAPAGMRFEMSKRNETIAERDLAKRYDNARFTYYEVGV